MRATLSEIRHSDFVIPSPERVNYVAKNTLPRHNSRDKTFVPSPHLATWSLGDHLCREKRDFAT